MGFKRSAKSGKPKQVGEEYSLAAQDIIAGAAAYEGVSNKCSVGTHSVPNAEEGSALKCERCAFPLHEQFETTAEKTAARQILVEKGCTEALRTIGKGVKKHKERWIAEKKEGKKRVFEPMAVGALRDMVSYMRERSKIFIEIEGNENWWVPMGFDNEEEAVELVISGEAAVETLAVRDKYDKDLLNTKSDSKKVNITAQAKRLRAMGIIKTDSEESEWINKKMA